MNPTRLPRNTGATTTAVAPDPFADAACRAYPPHLGLWDEVRLGDAAPELAVALPVCWSCPIRRHCEQTARADELRTAELGGAPAAHGVWGGRSPRERHSDARRWHHPDREEDPGCRAQGCDAVTWAGRSAPWCAEHLIETRRWTLVAPQDLPASLDARARQRRAGNRPRHTETWSQRRSAERRARREAAAPSLPGPRGSADDAVLERER